MARFVMGIFSASLLLLLLLPHTLPAQDNFPGPRADHYLDHVVLGINDLEAGMKALHEMTGVRPKHDGSDPQLGTHSAIIGLGDKAFLEIIAPDPEADLSAVDPDLRARILDRLAEFESLTPFMWAVGTGNLEKTLLITRRAGSRPSDIMTASRKRSWRKKVDWTWGRVDRPDSNAAPIFVQWSADTEPPQQRAPKGCVLTGVDAHTRFFNSLQALVASLQVDAETIGSDSDSLGFSLECKGRDVVFEPVPLVKVYQIPDSPQREASEVK